MATSYSTVPEEPLVASKPQGKSIKALVVGAAVASFLLGALAATVVTSSAPSAPEDDTAEPDVR